MPRGTVEEEGSPTRVLPPLWHKMGEEDAGAERWHGEGRVDSGIAAERHHRKI